MRTFTIAIAASMLALLAPPALPTSSLQLPPSCSMNASGATFSNLTWSIKSGVADPDNNTFDPKNVSCDASGALHLRLLNRSGTWTAAEVVTNASFGFGHYQFQVEGPLNTLDRRVVLGLFLYADPSPTKYNEIDLEYARWNDNATPGASYSVWPALRHAPPSPDCAPGDQRPQLAANDLGHGLVPDAVSAVTEPLHCTHDFKPNFTGVASTPRIAWSSSRVAFETLDGLQDGEQGLLSTYTFAPRFPKSFIPQAPMQIHLNLYRLGGTGPTDDQEVEVIIRSVRAP